MSKKYSARSHPSIHHLIKDRDDWPIASLVVLISAGGNPARAELYIHLCATEVESIEYLEETALATARKIITKEYPSDDPTTTKLEVRVQHVDQRKPVEFFDLHLIEEREKQSLFDPWVWAAIASILMILTGVIWGFSTLFNRSSGNSLSTTESGTAEIRAATDGVSPSIRENENGQSATTVLDSSSSDKQANANANSIAGSGQGNSQDATQTNTIAADPALPQTNGLPPSTNANNNLRLDQRVRVVPGAALTLRSQPGINGGEAIGFMENSQEATIIGGPYWLQGEADTIVWWYIRLDSGEEAWAAANDSQFTLLEAAPRG